MFGSKGVLEFQSGYQKTAWLLRDAAWSPGRSGAKWEAISSNGVGKPETRDNKHGSNHAAVLDLIDAIEKGDAGCLKQIKGIGPKMANRLVVELKGKLPETVAGVRGEDTSSSLVAIAALQNLGYDRAEAQEAVRRAASELPKDFPLAIPIISPAVPSYSSSPDFFIIQVRICVSPVP